VLDEGFGREISSWSISEDVMNECAFCDKPGIHMNAVDGMLCEDHYDQDVEAFDDAYELVPCEPWEGE
jgi:hypothetical protein